MIFSCLASMTLFATQVFTPIQPKIATFTIDKCTIASATRHSWIVANWTFLESGYKARITLNHQFDAEDCKVEKMFWYVDDRLPGVNLTRTERKMLERWRGDVNLSVWRFAIDQCKLAKKAGMVWEHH
jgi:hypothetical protein